MNIDIRKHIIDNFKDTNKDEIRSSIVDSIKDKEVCYDEKCIFT